MAGDSLESVRVTAEVDSRDTSELFWCSLYYLHPSLTFSIIMSIGYLVSLRLVDIT